MTAGTITPTVGQMELKIERETLDLIRDTVRPSLVTGLLLPPVPG